MKIDDLMKKELPTIPYEIQEALSKNDITLTSFDKKNDILKFDELQKEVGYHKLEDDSYLVSMTCPMPNITPEMIKWWFWWHAQKDERYQVWFPGAHISIKYSKKQSNYFKCKKCPPFQNNTHYPVEKIGSKEAALKIDFVTPEEFGFSKIAMDENNIPLIVCGHIGPSNGLYRHSKMAHIFKQTDDGLFMISRFWLGHTIKIPLLRKRFFTDKMAKGMAEHCCIEYRNLLEILPILYQENN